MDDIITRQIQDLQKLITEKGENYKTALASHVNFDTLKEMRLHIRKMKRFTGFVR